MRYGFLLSIALAGALTGTPSAAAATFGTVVPIGGHASDIALDESRGVLYIANFTANRIEVMSLTDGSIQTSMNVAPQPGAITISPDYQYLLVAHFGNFTTPSTAQNGLTLINLNDNSRQTFSTGDVPLGAAFVSDGTAVIVTSTSILQFDPVTGALGVMATFANLATTLPAKLGTFPTQVILASLATTPDLSVLYGVADDGTFQAYYRYDVNKRQIFAAGFVASPKPLPRITVSDDGAWAMVGMYKIDATDHDLNQFPNAITSLNIGGNAVDSRAGIIYSQIVSQLPQTASSSSGGNSLGGAASALGGGASAPTIGNQQMYILDADNLNVRETINLPENITGRMTLNSSRSVVYAVSDSGVMILPVGSLNKNHRVAATQSDVMVSGNFCNRNVITQTLTITDPGGGATDFIVSVNQAGVTVTPPSGITPATVQVKIDPNAFQNQNGTVAIPITISSSSAVNVPPPVRLLVNNRNPDQRGTIVNVPGVLTDILADPVRNRFYVVRQDANQVLVFDSTSYKQIATLRTGTTPTQLAMTFDRQWLLVGHDDSQFAFVFNLDTLQPDTPIQFPGGHYPRQIAASGKAILSLVRDVTGDAPGTIDTVDMASRKATQLPSLGIYKNNVDPGGVLAAAPNGAAIMAAMPDGNVLLYDANQDTFTISRKDYTTLGGAYGASSYNTYVVGNYLMNASLVTTATLESSSGATSGFAFVDTTGLRTTFPAASSPGVIQRVDPAHSLGIKPTRMVEAPLGTSLAQPFIRSLAPLADQSAVISLSISGITVLPWAYDAAVAPPKITSIVNAADGTQPVAPGGLISVMGQQMSPVNVATSDIPLPTALGESCLTVNGVAVPMLFVSSQQINAQLPFTVGGNSVMQLRTPGGISDNFNFTIYPAAPSIFRSGTAGPVTNLATVVRTDNNQLVTPTNPIHPGDSIVIYATGMGQTSPAIDAGLPAPADPLASVILTPQVLLGGVALPLSYAGMVPGMIGEYQINATVPKNVPQGLSIPLVVNQGGMSTSLNLRVVN